MSEDDQVDPKDGAIAPDEGPGIFGKIRGALGRMRAKPDDQAEDGQAQSKVLAELARSLMAEFGIDPSPDNYQVWYSYVRAENPRLNEVIDEIRESGEIFSGEICEELHDRFFGIEREAIAVFEASRNTERLISALKDELDQANSKERTRGKNLGVLERKLQQSNDKADIQQILSGLIEETRQITATAGRLEQRLVRSTSELRQLRGHLRDTQRDANTDPLTGLVNKRYFEFSLKDRVKQSKRTGLPFAAMVVDVDNIQALTQEKGQATSDVVLFDVAQSLASNLKKRDVVARIDDDHFGILMPDTNLPACMAMAELLRSGVSELAIKPNGLNKPSLHVTVSIGAASHKKDEPGERLTGRAERALATAKGRGGDRAVSEVEIEMHGRPKISNDT